MRRDVRQMERSVVSGSRGFTLVEVLVAAGLISFVALAIAPMILMAVQTSAAAQEATELAAIGAARMEILRTLPFSDPGLAAGGSTANSMANYSDDPYNGDANIYVRWQVVDENATRKRIDLVAGVRTSIWGPPREVNISGFRTDLQ